MIYGYELVSTVGQTDGNRFEEQETKIRETYPTAIMFEEAYSGACVYSDGETKSRRCVGCNEGGLVLSHNDEYSVYAKKVAAGKMTVEEVISELDINRSKWYIL